MKSRYEIRVSVVTEHGNDIVEILKEIAEKLDMLRSTDRVEIELVEITSVKIDV